MAGTTDSLPLIYTLFFLYIEPIATASGAYMGWFQPAEYLAMTYPAGATNNLLGVPVVSRVVLDQLANMYFVFALNEALVLRATKDLAVWRIFLLGLLIADFGHVFSVRHTGLERYYSFWTWNAMDAGNLGFVYVGAAMRTAFLLGIGIPGTDADKAKAKAN